MNTLSIYKSVFYLLIYFANNPGESYSLIDLKNLLESNFKHFSNVNINPTNSFRVKITACPHTNNGSATSWEDLSNVQETIRGVFDIPITVQNPKKLFYSATINKHSGNSLNLQISPIMQCQLKSTKQYLKFPGVSNVLIIVQENKGSLSSEDFEPFDIEMKITLSYLVTPVQIYRLCYFCADLGKSFWAPAENLEGFENSVRSNYNKAEFTAMLTEFNGGINKHVLENLETFPIAYHKLSSNLSAQFPPPILYLFREFADRFNLTVKLYSSEDFGTRDLFHFYAGLSTYLSYISHYLKNYNLYVSGKNWDVAFISSSGKDKNSENIRLQTVIEPLGKWTAISVLPSVVVTALVLWLISISQIGYNNSHLNDYIGTIIRPLLDQAMENNLPSNKMTFRIIFSAWLFYSLIISECYRGTLISFLMAKLSSQNLETFADLVEHNATLCSLPKLPQRMYYGTAFITSQAEEAMRAEIAARYKSEFDFVMKKLKKPSALPIGNGKSVTEGENDEVWVDIYKRIIDNNEVFVGPVPIVQMIGSLVEKFHSRKAYVISSETLSRKQVYTVAKDPFPQVGNILKGFQSSGLVWRLTAVYMQLSKAKAISSITSNQKHKNEILKIASIENGPKVMILSHIKAPVVLWFIGVAISILVFITELLILFSYSRSIDHNSLPMHTKINVQPYDVTKC